MITNILASLFLFNSPIQIAVVDTGYTRGIIFNAPLCADGHRDFTDDQKYEDGIPVDEIGHGSNVAGLIHQYAIGINLNESLHDLNKMKKLAESNSDYCLIIVKAFSTKSNLDNYIQALRYVKSLSNVKIVNISAGGNTFDSQEKKLIKDILDDKKIVVAAAGNNGENIDINHFYPASSDSRIIVVGNSFTDKVQETNNKVYSKSYAKKVFNIVSTSNYGSEVDVFVNGISRLSLSSRKDKLEALTGTSQAAAVFTGMKINDIINKNLTSKQARNK